MAWRASVLFALLVSWPLVVPACDAGDGAQAAAPVAHDDELEVVEDEPGVVDVLANDEGDGLTLIDVGAPSHGSASLDDGRVRYAPAADYFGADDFEYTAEGTGGRQTTARVVVWVVAANDAPRAAADSVDTGEDTPVVIDVLANDEDRDDDTLALEVVAPPAHGEAAVVDARIRYTPAPGFDGVDRFGYAAVDVQGARGEAEVTVTVSGQDDPPTAAADAFAVLEGEPTTLDVLANDHDPEAAVLTVAVTAAPSHGSVVASDGWLTYTPKPRYNGYDELAYRVTDPGGASASATVSVTVYAALDDPAAAPQVMMPRIGLGPDEVAVVVNDEDPQSVAVAAYYLEQRPIPPENVVHLAFEVDGPVLSEAAFAGLHAELNAALGPDVQALALTWTEPYRVACMSITSAFALGFDEAFCNTTGEGCGPTAPIDYYLSTSSRPFDDHGIRPAMALAGVTADDVFSLIDRGVASDRTFPSGAAVMIRTTDEARSVRWPSFLSATYDWEGSPHIAAEYIDNADGSGADYVTGREDLLFYFTGLTQVPGIDENTYLPGAVADHLTSFGGELTGGGQMSALRWLEAGAVASYGTALEPCNFVTKFPNPRFMMRAYFRGETVLEAYWKSVSWPGEGVFVGEPLARPWGRSFLEHVAGALVIRTSMLAPGRTYSVQAADQRDGPYEVVTDGVTVKNPGLQAVELPAAGRPFYRLMEELGGADP